MERKLQVAEAFRIPPLPDAVAGLTVGGVLEESLLATYHDTPDLRLVRNGASLRFRRNGGRSEWTLKVLDPLGGDAEALDRREITTGGTRNRVPDRLRSLLVPLAGDGAVAKVAVLRTERTVRPLLLEGRHVASLVDDRVIVDEGPETGTSFRELEIELAPAGIDDPEALGLVDEVARVLIESGARSEGAVPKLHRALGDALPVAVPLTRRSTTADLALVALQRGLRQLALHEVGLLTRRDPEDVHGARVATRRLRSDLTTLRGAFDPEWLAGIRFDLRRLAGALGAVRDLDVLHERFARSIEEEADADPHATLLLGIERARALRLAELEDEIGTDAHRTLLERLHLAASTAPDGVRAAQGARAAAEEIVERAVRQLHRAARRADHGAPDEELHAVRILAKRCRYAAELVRPVLPKARRVARVATDVQTVLGELNDASVARAWLASVAPGLPSVEAFAAGLLAAGEDDRADAARRAWPDVRRKVRDLRER